MKKTSLVTEVLIPFAVLVAIAVFEGCAPAPQAKTIGSSPVGMGDIHLVDNQQTNQRARAADLARWVAMGEYYSKPVGMGDLHLAESRQPIPVTGSENSMVPSHTTADWFRFWEQQEAASQNTAQDTADQASGHTYRGTGDPIRFRARPVPTPKTNGQPNPGMTDVRRTIDEAKGR